MIDLSALSVETTLTVTVKGLRAQHDGAEILVSVLLETGEHREQRNLPITTEQYCELHPTCGVITETFYEQLEAASDLCRAIRCGENLLSYGSNSAQMLAQKIARHGFRRDVAQAAAEKLTDRGLIDEEGDLKREVEKCLRKLWGAKRISSHLWGRGFGSDAMATLPMLFEEIDFEKNCAALIRKHYSSLPTEPDEERRMIASLGRYGYTLTQIRAAMRDVASDGRP